MTKKGSLVGSSLWSMVGGLGDKLIGFTVFLLLARLLTPEQFGVVALSAVLIDIAMVLARLGISEAMIRQKRLPDFMADTAFWLCNIVALSLAACCIIIAPYIAQWYDEPQMTNIVQALSLVFIFTAPGIVHEALLMRQMQFKQIAIRNSLATLLSGVVAVYLALADYGVWALVFQKLTMSLVNTFFIWWAVPWRPVFRFSRRAAMRLTSFGAQVTSSNAIWLANARIHEIILGSALGTEAVGYYRIAWRGYEMIIDMALKPIARVAITAFSSLQDQPERFSLTYARFVMASSLIATPCFLGAAAIAPELITTVFGEQWSKSAELFPIIACMCVPVIIGIYMSPAFIASGHPLLMTKLAVLQLTLSSILTLIAVDYGLIAVAIAQLIKSYVMMPLSLYLLSRYAGVKVGRIYRASVPFLIASAIMAVAVLWLRDMSIDWVSGSELIIRSASYPDATLIIPVNVLRLVVLALAGAMIYGGIVIMICRHFMKEDTASILQFMPSKLQAPCKRVLQTRRTRNTK